MCRRFSFFVLVAVFVAATAVARDRRDELTVDLRFAPQEGVDTNSPDLSASMLERPVTLRFEDGRDDDALVIGHGTNDDDQRFPIRASTDVLAYVRDTLTQVAADWDVKVEDPADRVLTIRLTRFYVDEGNKAVGSVYASEVKMTFALADKGGKRLMEGAASGSAHRYGRARSGDNCNEVLSDALKEAYANVLSDPRLQEAWVSGKSSGGGSGGSAKPESVEERLRKLDDLLKKGLITKEEYDKKRAEILKDV
ncbi:MAG TPA: SHOCT domain-containing protein [Thermoanaerobaculia bacterium]|jgi:hypothetical protein|nr:SHOCT domain-containing protein [Thermoanaerobaculia bacterium]